MFEEGFFWKFVEKMDLNWEQNQRVAEACHLTLCKNPLQSAWDVWRLNDVKLQADSIDKAFVGVWHHYDDNTLIMTNELEFWWQYLLYKSNKVLTRLCD